MVLITKGTTDTQGIVILETLWNVVEALIDTRLCANVQFHDVLHRLRTGRGTGMVTIELKLVQELSRIDHAPLFLVFMDLRKAYETVERERLNLTLERYGVGPLLCGLLETFWSHQQVVTRQNGFHVTAFPVTWRTTQGGVVFQTLFNVVIDNFIRIWLAMTVEDQRIDHNRMGENLRQ